MTTEQTTQKISKRGGAREGAGRKKTLPEGTRTTSFILTEEERLAVKKYVAKMRQEGMPQKSAKVPDINWERTIFEAGIKMLKPIAFAIIEEDNGKFKRAENFLKDIAVIAFKDAVSDYEHKIGRR
ncbi:MAG: hypothetical protein SO119_08570 [Phascolarctobacterium sp.]|nr:hypothetical protein [Phascolarctobacterium sp.]